MNLPIYAFAGSLTRPMPPYGAANGKGITRLTFDEVNGTLSMVDVTGVDDTAWLVTDSEPLQKYRRRLADVGQAHRLLAATTSLKHE
jgi:hypothetical protein